MSDQNEILPGLPTLTDDTLSQKTPYNCNRSVTKLETQRQTPTDEGNGTISSLKEDSDKHQLKHIREGTTDTHVRGRSRSVSVEESNSDGDEFDAYGVATNQHSDLFEQCVVCHHSIRQHNSK